MFYDVLRSFLQMSGAGLTPFEPPPMPPPPSCVINFKKDENKLSRDGRDSLKEKVEFGATVISFSDFNVKMKEVMENQWPMATFTTPTIKINGEVCLFVFLSVCLFVCLFVF